MSEEATVLTDEADGVLVITINRPEAKNAVNLSVAKGVAAALERLDSDDSLRVGVLTGAGGTLDAIPQSLRGVPVRPGESFSTTEGTIVVDEVHPDGGAVITADTVPAGGVDTSSAPTDEPTDRP